MIGTRSKAMSGGRRVVRSTLLGIGFLLSALEGVSAATDFYCHTVANSYCGTYLAEKNGFQPQSACLYLGAFNGTYRPLYQNVQGQFSLRGRSYPKDGFGHSFNGVSFIQASSSGRWSYFTDVTLAGFACWEIDPLTNDQLVNHGFSTPQISANVFNGGFSVSSTILGYGACTIPGC